MRRRVLFIALLFAAGLGTAKADSKQWETTDTALFAGAMAGLFIDWNQTRKLTYVSEYTQTARVASGSTRMGLPLVGGLANPVGPEIIVSQVRWRPHSEGNRLLGREPSNAEINRYFIVSTAAVAGLAFVLPTEWRRVLLGSVLVTQTTIVLDNHGRLGLRVNF